MSEYESDKPATVTEVVTEARRHAIHAVKRLRAVMDGAGGRGAMPINVACKVMLEAARVTGGEAEELEKLPLDQAVARLRLVDKSEALAELQRRRQLNSNNQSTARADSAVSGMSSTHPANRTGGAR